MLGLGTLFNAVGVVAGGLLGLTIGHVLSARIQESLMKVAGVAVLFLGLAGTLEKMLQVTNTQLKVNGAMLLIICLLSGTLIGEILNIERGFERFGEWLKKITRNEKDSSFVDAFLVTSLTICVGAMGIVGAIQDGLTGDYSILLAKAVLDAIVVLILTVSEGKGAIFSVIPLIIIQEGITLLAQFISPIMTIEALANLSMVGSVLIFCVGTNLIWGKMFKVANMLPAVILAIFCSFLPFF